MVEEVNKSNNIKNYIDKIMNDIEKYNQNK